MKVSKPGTITLILLALVVGFGTAYVRNSVRFVTASGLLYGGPRTGDSFTQAFDKLAHLGTIEYAAANCSGTSDVQVALTNERKILVLLEEDSKHPGHQPIPIAAAQARLAVREMIETEGRPSTQIDSGSAERARSSAASAGWKDSSDAHLRQIIGALDRDICALPGGGATSR
jgi:hypothetical protein